MVTSALNRMSLHMGLMTGERSSGLPFGGPLNLFNYDIDFVNNTVFGGTQPYGNNTDDGRFFRDPNNVNASFVPNAAGLLISQASAGLRRTDKGHCQYPGGTVRNLWNRDMTNAAWVKTNMTAAKDQTGADGTASAASSLLATAANATCLQTITLASSTVLLSVDIKRLVGTGNIDMTVDGGTTWTTVATTASYVQKFIVQAAVTNPVLGFRIVTSGDKIAVDFTSIVNPANAGINIPSQYRATTTSGTVLCAQSRPSADVADAAPKSLITAAQGAFSFYWQGRSERTTGCFIMTGATNVFCSVLATGSGGAVQFADGPGSSKTADLTWKVGLNQVNKVAGYVTAGGAIKVAANGVLGNAGTGATLETLLDHFDLGTNGSGANSIYGFSERFSMGVGTTISDADLTTLTT